MTEPSAPTPEPPNTPPPAIRADPQAAASTGVWERLKQHKVAQWTLAYAAAAYTLLHAVGMLSEAQGWPHAIARVLSYLLLLAAPVVITLAWYHGARGLRRVSAGELSIITLLGVIAGSVLWSMESTRAKESHDNPAEIGKTPAAAESESEPNRPPANSVAVLAFTNLTGDPTKEYIGDGLSDEIINELSQIQELKVPARTSSFAYKGRNPDARQIGRDLDVANILEGSVRAEGTRIRVIAQLINAEDGLHVWSKTFEEEVTGILKLQEDLAQSIAAALKVNLAETGSPAGALTKNVEAYQLYLQASAMASTVDSAAGLEFARQAVAKDPSFARAHALLAGLTIISVPTLGPALTDAIAEGRREAMLALKLEPRLARALYTLGFIESVEGHWIEAEKYYREGFSADPSDSINHIIYGGSQLMRVGHQRKAIEEYRMAYRLAPALPAMSVALAGALSNAGQDAEALKYQDQAVRLGVSAETAHGLLLDLAHGDLQDTAHELALYFPVALQNADFEEALRDILRAHRDPSQRPGASKRLLEIVAATDGSRLDDGSHLDADSSARIAFLYVIGGDLDAAYAQADKTLDRVVRSGYPGYGGLSSFIWFSDALSFRQDPRFGKFVSRFGMMSYWKQYGPPDDCDLKDDKLTCR